MSRPVLLLTLGFLFAACATHHDRNEEPVNIPRTEVANSREYTYTPSDWPQALKATVRRPDGAMPGE